MLKKSLNYFSLIAILALSVCFMTSCSRDDSDEVIDASKIEGQWLMTREIWKSIEYGQVSSENQDVTNELKIWDFQSDGTLKIYCGFDLCKTGKWSVERNNLTIKKWDEYEEEYSVEIYTLTISDGKLIIRYSEKDEEGEYYEEYHFDNVKSLEDITPDLLGRWHMIKQTYHIDGVLDGNNDTDVEEDGILWEFLSDGDLNMYKNENILEGRYKWRSIGKILAVIYDESYMPTYTVSISSNNMIIRRNFSSDESIEEFHFVREGYSNIDDTPNNPTEEATIVGNWEVAQVTTKYYTTIPEMQDYNNVEVESGNGEYWEFSSNKLIVHDPSDVMNGKVVSYTYNKSEGILSIPGWLTYEVTELTSRKMTLMTDHNDGKFGTTTIIDFIKK